MKQTEAFGFDAQSPCIGICKMDEHGYCKGCSRSRQERYHWNGLDDAQKMEIICRCVQRKKSRVGLS